MMNTVTTLPPGIPIKNRRHELFAQAVATGETATGAYRTAGYKPHRQSAAKLLTKADIKARVERIQEAADLVSRLSKERALEILASIALNKDAKASDRIAAIKVAGAWLGWETGTQAEQAQAGAFVSLAEQMAQIRNLPR